MADSQRSLAGCFLGELAGTFILVFFGCGVVHAAVLTGAQQGLWQVAVVWGVAVTVAIYVVGGLSGAHINPAITLAMAIFRGFPLPLVPFYALGQLLGAMLAGAVLVVLFDPMLRLKESGLQDRGHLGSVFTARCYGEYYPNLDRFESFYEGTHDKEVANKWLTERMTLVKEGTAFFAEFVGTLLLALVVMAVTDPRNQAAPAARLGPVFIGLTVAILISVLAPITQCCLNPARDFGPRLTAYLAGWGEVAIPGPNGRGFWTVYIVAPCVGALAGGALYSLVLRPLLPDVAAAADGENE